MKIEPLRSEDLAEVESLQPEGWSDILPSIREYCILDFCFPLKASIGTTLVGIGTAIFHRSTAWLGHIIVHKDYRNHGVGSTITKSLIDLVQKKRSKSILLIATPLGEPVYKKVGFEVQTKYLFLENGVIPEGQSTQVRSFEKKHEAPLLAFDRALSGEDRSELIYRHLPQARIYLENNILRGFYLPSLGEGLTLADTADAGLALLTSRYADHKKICLPLDNEDAISVLQRNKFSEVRRASRMILGEKFSWSPAKMYSRIGGNLG
jgi:GNAT superfamily N-acetyltransferase